MQARSELASCSRRGRPSGASICSSIALAAVWQARSAARPLRVRLACRMRPYPQGVESVGGQACFRGVLAGVSQAVVRMLQISGSAQSAGLMAAARR
jgi:hypothetical protein